MSVSAMPGLFADITAPYTAIEAWTYDAFIAPAVAETHPPAVEPSLS